MLSANSVRDAVKTCRILHESVVKTIFDEISGYHPVSLRWQRWMTATIARERVGKPSADFGVVRSTGTDAAMGRAVKCWFLLVSLGYAWLS